MTEQELERGKVLINQINTTKKAIEKLEQVLQKASFHWLTISEHSDGWGWALNLNRPEHNKVLLEAIYAELKEQLQQATTEFEQL